MDCRTHAPEGRPFTAGIIGRISYWKGQHVFLEAFVRAFPEGDERALIIGAPLFGAEDRAYDADLRDRTRRAQLDGRVQFIGFTEDVPGMLSSLDVLVHASVLPEPFGQVVAEGLCAGLPVVATDGGGPAEMIDHGVNGFLVPPGDAARLADILRRISREPALGQAVGMRAKQMAERFLPETVGAQVLGVYRAALSPSLSGDRHEGQHQGEPDSIR
jgi:glycosyltransferase involved in cell wall biosynthesis